MADTATGRTGTGGRPAPRPAPSLVHTATGRMLVLALATITFVVEMGSLLAHVDLTVGSFSLSASVVPSLLLLVFLGARSVGEARDRDRLVPFWIAMVAGLGLGVTLFSRSGDVVDVGALLVAATNEEVVYRFAVPVVGATALMVLRVPATAARVAGYLAAGAWWVLLPGHQEQVESPANLATYVAFAIISALVVARSRAIVPMAVAHCVLNIITVAHMRGEITDASRGALSACLLFLLVGTFAWPGDLRRRAADREDLVSDTVIDLRDGRTPSVRQGDAVVYLEDEVDPALTVDVTDEAVAAEPEPAEVSRSPRA
ncbi:hypothetical protein HC251_01165 [Iamia sp. SCSIO 61187]|uniref:hypothetical protein n=1 Tax=Iamia sp. SCSIO 61187 TaxID=2722752 RepID=UPI001C635125|nr:hypothetical protein [Iamia sp. SCSIO 61187]QYG91180.1 hypothetical protein HC251_01165 [Iamia sp. SCSIO 61187]